MTSTPTPFVNVAGRAAQVERPTRDGQMVCGLCGCDAANKVLSVKDAMGVTQEICTPCIADDPDMTIAPPAA